MHNLTNWFRYRLCYEIKYWIRFPITFLRRVILGDDVRAKRLFFDKWGYWNIGSGRSDRPANAIWLIANSGGEVLQSVSFIQQIKKKFPDFFLILSTESYDTFFYARGLKEVDCVAFTPLDIPHVCRKLLKKINPIAIVIIQYCDYPMLLMQAKKLGVKVLMFSARLNYELFKDNYAVRRAFALKFYDFIDFFGVKSLQDSDNLHALGVDKGRIGILGDMKMDLEHILLTPERKSELKKELKIKENDPVFTVSSLHEQEIGLILETFGLIRRKFPKLKLMVAPRWKSDMVALEDKAIGRYRTVLRSKIDLAQGEDYDILIIDTFGEVPFLYGLSSVAYIASSIIPLNERRLGHNILEPLAHGVPVLFGPNMRLWSNVTPRIKQVWPQCEVADALALAESAIMILSEKELSSKVALAGRELALVNQGIVSNYVNYFCSRFN